MNLKATICILASTVLFAACSGKSHNSGGGNDSNNGSLDTQAQGIVKATAYIPVEIGANGSIRPMATATFPVTIVNPPNVTFNVDTSATIVPVISNSMLDFGKIAISALVDNNLRVCGTTTPKKKCSSAFIRMYTTGVAGAGVWNADGGYGMPIYANKTGTPGLTVGLEAAKAAVVQSFTIPAAQNVVRLVNFPTPAYELHSDFSEAGAGSYSTTLVIEYGLLE